jgi:hypothetical protein
MKRLRVHRVGSFFFSWSRRLWSDLGAGRTVGEEVPEHLEHANLQELDVPVFLDGHFVDLVIAALAAREFGIRALAELAVAVRVLPLALTGREELVLAEDLADVIDEPTHGDLPDTKVSALLNNALNWSKQVADYYLCYLYINNFPTGAAL